MTAPRQHHNVTLAVLAVAALSEVAAAADAGALTAGSG